MNACTNQLTDLLTDLLWKWNGGLTAFQTKILPKVNKKVA